MLTEIHGVNFQNFVEVDSYVITTYYLKIPTKISGKKLNIVDNMVLPLNYACLGIKWFIGITNKFENNQKFQVFFCSKHN